MVCLILFNIGDADAIISPSPVISSVFCFRPKLRFKTLDKIYISCNSLASMNLRSFSVHIQISPSEGSFRTCSMLSVWETFLQSSSRYFEHLHKDIISMLVMFKLAVSHSLVRHVANDVQYIHVVFELISWQIYENVKTCCSS